MSVNGVLDLAPVDLHTGHVEFDGSLVMKGDVHPDMKVRVTKDLVVAGFIESADVEAGGEVIAKKGIIGPAALGALHTCRVTGRNIRTHYVQHAQLEAEDEGRRRQVAELVAGCRVTATAGIHAGGALVCPDARHRFGPDRGPGTPGMREGNWVGLDE